MLLGTAFAVLGGGCESCVAPQGRPVTASCGTSLECDSRVCKQGVCTVPCQSDSDCKTAAAFCIESHCYVGADDFDGDGLTNARERELGTDQARKDTDNDGLPDGAEASDDAAPDKNGDGTIDALQSNLVDSDNDCIVDAWDSNPYQSSLDELPAASVFCNEGVCSTDLEEVTVVCRKDTPTHEQVIMGCVGCGCAMKGGNPPFEVTESLCDGIDNDCDGVTDEDMTFNGSPLGAGCIAKFGICKDAGADGATQSGVVQCSATGQTVCSVGLGGSQTLALEERCNGRDDDCDGAVDEGFSHLGVEVGASCGPCGSPLRVCEDGSIANPPEVRCAPGGGTASCSGQAFDQAFERAKAGSPPPQSRRTVEWSPSWRRVVQYGGAVPTPTGVTQTDDLWWLPASDTTQPMPWQLSSSQPPQMRQGAALAWDQPADRFLLLGGYRGGVGETTIWMLQSSGAWTNVSASIQTASAMYVPPLPANEVASHGRAIIVEDAAFRFLVFFAEGRPTPFAVRLNGPSLQRKWTSVASPSPLPGHTALSGSITCAATRTSNSKSAVVMMAPTLGSKAGVYEVGIESGQVKISAMKTQGPGPTTEKFGCAFELADKLHVIGGNALGGDTNSMGSHVSANVTGTQLGKGTVAWALPQSAPLNAARAEATLRWDAAKGRFLLMGGYRVSAGKRYAADSVLTWLPGAVTATSLSADTPPHRIGHATSHSHKYGLCVAGGLQVELPPTDGQPARFVPLRDAWCLNSGSWQQVTDQLQPWAFGAAALDHHDDRFIFAGGLQLDSDVAQPDIEKLIQGSLTFSDSATGTFKVTSAVQTLHIGSGQVELNGKGPGLAAMTFAHDRAARRLVTFGGFNNQRPTIELWELDLLQMKWRLVSERFEGEQSPLGARPLPQYGGAMVYSDTSKRLLLVPGAQFLRNEKKKTWSLTYQVLNPGPGETLLIDPCRGDRKTLLWFIDAGLQPTVMPEAVPTFEDLVSSPPQTPLYQPHFGQPAFVPFMYDAGSSHGVVLLPETRRYATKDQSGLDCPGSTTPKWFKATRPIHIVIGRCEQATVAFLSATTMTKRPDATVLSGTSFDEIQRVAWLWGGIRPGGAASNATWTLAQRCKVDPP